MKDGFWKINAFRPEIKAIKGKTRKFNFGLKSKLERIGEPMEEFPFFLYIKAVWELKENGVTNWKQQTSAQNTAVVVRWLMSWTIYHSIRKIIKKDKEQMEEIKSRYSTRESFISELAFAMSNHDIQEEQYRCHSTMVSMA